MVNKQELIDFIDDFPSSVITKQDVLDFIESSKVTRFNLQDCKLTINGKEELQFMFFRSGGVSKLAGRKFGEKVFVTFGPMSVDCDDISSLTGYLLSNGYRLSSVIGKELVFVK